MFSKIGCKNYNILYFYSLKKIEKGRDVLPVISRCCGTCAFHMGNQLCKFIPSTEEIKLYIYNIFGDFGQNPELSFPDWKLHTSSDLGPTLTGGLDWMTSGGSF